MEQKEFKEELETRKMKLIKELVSISGFDFAKNNSKINSDDKIETQEVEKKYKDYLEGFDKIFETHTKERLKESPLLIKIFREFIEEEYCPTKMYKEIIDIEKKIKNKMKETFTDEQMNLLEQYQNCEDKILQDMVEQAFVFGYAMSNELKYEATRYYNKK